MAGAVAKAAGSAAQAETKQVGHGLKGGSVLPGPDDHEWHPLPTGPFPVNIEARAQRYVTQYDRDGDGAINVTAFGNETTRESLYDVIRDIRMMGGHEESYRLPEQRHNIERLARFADLASNHDGQATAEEIADVMRKYDTGDAFADVSGATADDGQLEGNEYSAFIEDFGEETLPSLWDYPDWDQPWVKLRPDPPNWNRPKLIDEAPQYAKFGTTPK